MDSNLVEEEDERIPGIAYHQLLVFSLREPGITVLRVQPSATQRQKAGIQALAAMLVCQVNATEEAFLIGDLIIALEGIPVTDINVLTSILKEKHPAILSTRVLRGDTVLDVNIQSMP
jgi:S1-C subfamily serine protease